MKDCMLFCEKLPNTRAPLVASDKEFLDVMRAAIMILIDPATGSLYPGALNHAYWLPVTYSKIERQWNDFYTSEPVDILGVAAGELNGGRLDNCAIAVTVRKGWQDMPCRASRGGLIQCACESRGQMYLTMRGLCRYSNIDRHFVPQNKKYDGRILFRGLFKTIIEYHTMDKLWHLKVVDANSITVATSDASKRSFLLGMSNWRVTGDNESCNRGMPYTTVLKLSGCKKTEFTCHDGECIEMEERCDQIIHCRDQ